MTTIGTVPMSAFGGYAYTGQKNIFPRVEIENAVSDGLKALVEAAEFRDGRIDATSLDIRVSTLSPKPGQLGDVLVVSVAADVEVPL